MSTFRQHTNSDWQGSLQGLLEVIVAKYKQCRMLLSRVWQQNYKVVCGLQAADQLSLDWLTSYGT